VFTQIGVRGIISVIGVIRKLPALTFPHSIKQKKAIPKDSLFLLLKDIYFSEMISRLAHYREAEFT
jgi:hypothetical protein